jgi:hypothetical protein
MTLQKIYLPEIKDIRYVRFTCNNCKATLSVTPTDVRDTPYYRCPNCKEEWFTSGGNNLKAMYDLFHGLSMLHERQAELPCTVQFELSEAQ